MFPIDVLRFSEFRTMRNHLSETLMLNDKEAVKCLSSLHDKYVIVSVDKASNNMVFVCKSYYFECLIKELGINSNTSSNTTYNINRVNPQTLYQRECLKRS
jgi:transcription elongation factor Elf1